MNHFEKYDGTDELLYFWELYWENVYRLYNRLVNGGLSSEDWLSSWEEYRALRLAFEIEGDVYDKLVRCLCNCAKTYSRLILAIEDSETYNPKMVLENQERANHRLKSDIECTLLEFDIWMSRCIKQQKGITSEEKICKNCKYRDEYDKCNTLTRDNLWHKVPDDFNCRFWCEKEKAIKEYIE